MMEVRKSGIKQSIALLITIFSLSYPTCAQYGGGSGRVEDPYLIFTAGHMNEIGTNPDDWDKHFILMADIDLSGFTGTDFNIIGKSSSNAFRGVFDGHGHQILNFTYTSRYINKNHIGLFGCVVWPGEIKDLGLIAPDVDAVTVSYVGSLVGELKRGTITDCYVEDGSIMGDRYVGVLVGYNDWGTITNCYSTGEVSGDENVGGLVGTYSERPSPRSMPPPFTISNCYSTSSVKGTRSVGGLVGANYKGRITDSYAMGNVSGEESIGGLVGQNGHLQWGSGLARSSTILNCYSTGPVSGESNVGGLVGLHVEGLVIACFWDIQTSGLSTGAGGTGLTTAEMQMASTFIEDGWDFIDETENGTEDIWWILEGRDYPTLVRKLSTLSPYPQNSATIVNTTVILSWKPRKQAASYQVYFGTDKDAIRTATTASPEYKGTKDLGSEHYDPGNLALSTTYYWRVDEVNNVNADSPRIGPIWSFTTFGFIHFPNPPNGATDIISSPILNWAASEPGIQYDIYFGRDEDAVANAIPANLGIYQGRQPGDVTSYDAGILELGQTYYWRVDGIDEADVNSPWTGPLWSFTTANFLIIDDFEAYNDLDPRDPTSNRIFNAWLSGFDYPLNYYPSVFVEQSMVHGGWQSMSFLYDNAFGKSEATLTLTALRDWTIGDVNVLSIWFHGDATNDPEKMYVVLNGIARVDNDNPDAVQEACWTEWRIDLARFADQGLNLANINSITIGFGNKNNQQPGGSGMVWIDDIRLYRPAP